MNPRISNSVNIIKVFLRKFNFLNIELIEFLQCDINIFISGLWLGTRTGAGGTAKLKAFLAAVHVSMDSRSVTLITPF